MNCKSIKNMLTVYHKNNRNIITFLENKREKDTIIMMKAKLKIVIILFQKLKNLEKLKNDI